VVLRCSDGRPHASSCHSDQPANVHRDCNWPEFSTPFPPPLFLCVWQLIPCLLLSILVHPSTTHFFINRILWAFCVYLEAVSVLPQLRTMQNAKARSLPPPPEKKRKRRAPRLPCPRLHSPCFTGCAF